MQGEDVRKHNRADLLVSVAVAALGVWLVVLSSHISPGTIRDPVGTWRLIEFGGYLFILVGAGLVVRHVVAWRRGKPLVPDGIKDEAGFPASAWRAYAVWGLTLALALLMPKVGFIWAAPVYVFGCMTLLGMRRWIRAIVIAVVLSYGVNYLFVHLLTIPLPPGTLW